MYRKANLLFLKAETPMHAGSGDSLGIVDMPIQREKHTGFPKIEASSLKGSMREHFERVKGEKDKEVLAAFGTDGDGNNADAQAGALGFTDARLLLFPVKSMKGVFAWITCPAIINKFNEELKLAGFDVKFDIQKGNIAAADSKLYVNDVNIILEEYTFKVETNEEVNKLGKWLSKELYGEDSDNYIANKLKSDIIVLENDDFKDFVNLSTEVITRTKIDNETGTVADGALFTEEYLPAESILYSLVLTAPEFAKKEKDEKEKNRKSKAEDEIRNFFKKFIEKNSVMQIGGNATLGKGITTTFFVEPKK